MRTLDLDKVADGEAKLLRGIAAVHGEFHQADAVYKPEAFAAPDKAKTLAMFEAGGFGRDASLFR